MLHLNIDTIVVPTDFSKTAQLAYKHALTLAKAFDAEVHLVHVTQAATNTTAVQEFADVQAVSVNLSEAIDNKLHNEAISLAKEWGVLVHSHLATGNLRSQLLSYAKNVGADLIVTGTKGSSGFKEFFIGSNSYRIVAESPCPVLSVREGNLEPSYSHIVMPIDGSRASRQKVMPTVDLARKLNATIHLAALFSSDDEEDRFHLNQHIAQVEDYLNKHYKNYIRKDLFGRNIAHIAMTYATAIDADLIVMMTEQEPSISGFFMGPYAQQLVNHSRIPVLSIGPEELPEAVDLPN